MVRGPLATMALIPLREIKTDRTPQSKFWVFTINNPEKYEDELKKFSDYDYIIMGKEVGEKEHTPHFQGFVMFNVRKRGAGVKKQHGRAHWEIMRGNSEEAMLYCRKD